MKLEIRDFCIRCGLCEDLYPDLFTIDYEKDEIKMLYDKIPEEKKEQAKGAIRDCAVTAIVLK